MFDIGEIVVNWIIIAILLLLNGYFVAAEFAYVRIRKTRIEELTEQGNFDAKLALETLKDMDEFIAAVQVGVTVASIGIGWVGELTIAKMLAPVLTFLPQGVQTVATHTISVVLAFLMITFLHVLIGEQVPKCIALQYPEKVSLQTAKSMRFVIWLCKPFVWLLTKTGAVILKLFKIEHVTGTRLAHSIDEIDMLINASYDGGMLNETEKDMLHNVVKFSDLNAKEVMIPRTDMACVTTEMTLDEINQFAAENQYTRYPIYEEDIDHIIGFIHVKDLYECSLKDEETDLKSLIRPILMVPETITMDKLVLEFKERKAQIAIVVDEFGGTSGLITLEDLLEEIFGDVQDEFDEEEEFEIKKVGEDTYLVDAMMRLDDFCEFFEIEEKDVDDEDIDTVAGLVVKLLGRLANENDKVNFQNLLFIVKETDGARISMLVVKKLPVAVETEKQD
ncbi:HlyC/CorC family transporter [bacterium]|nr:HlyC/CorC family transporter [bacterium]